MSNLVDLKKVSARGNMYFLTGILVYIRSVKKIKPKLNIQIQAVK